MPSYELIVTGESREIYQVDAESADAAVAMFRNGDLTNPVVSEVTSVDDVQVREDSGDGDGIVRPRKVRR